MCHSNEAEYFLRKVPQSHFLPVIAASVFFYLFAQKHLCSVLVWVTALTPTLEQHSSELPDTSFAKILRQLMCVFLLYHFIILKDNELKHIP